MASVTIPEATEPGGRGHPAKIAGRIRAMRAGRRQPHGEPTARASHLHDFDRALFAAETTEAVAETALRQLRQLLPARYITIVLFDFDAEQATVVAAYSQGNRRMRGGSRWPLSEVEIPAELRRGEPHQVEVSRGAELPPLPGMAARDDICSYVGLPLLADGELIGALNLGSD